MDSDLIIGGTCSACGQLTNEHIFVPVEGRLAKGSRCCEAPVYPRSPEDEPVDSPLVD
jgi:hypothetical protein